MNVVQKVSVCLMALTLLAPRAAPAAQDLLHRAKAQYAEAAYEEALSTLSAAADTPSADRVELEQYRALCLLALGEDEEAAGAVAAMVAADPRYVPPPAVASPKVLSFVASVRTAQLPTIIQSLIASGRTAFEHEDFDAAARDFALVQALVDDEAVEAWPDRQAVRTLADGFALLATTSARERASAAAATATPPAPALETTAAAAANGGTVRGDDSVALVIEPPVPILQNMPPWVPPDGVSGTRDYKGVLKIEIGVDGRVKSATIEEPSHPSYDSRLLQAARQWVFRPATRGGHPIESEKVIAVQLHARR